MSKMTCEMAALGGAGIAAAPSVDDGVGARCEVGESEKSVVKGISSDDFFLIKGTSSAQLSKGKEIYVQVQ